MFLIITTGLNGAKTELCRVERNAEPIAEAARRKRIRVRETHDQTVSRRADRRAGAAIMTAQLFGAESSTDDSLVGLAITLPEQCPRCRGHDAVIGAGRGPHKATTA